MIPYCYVTVGWKMQYWVLKVREGVMLVWLPSSRWCYYLAKLAAKNGLIIINVANRPWNWLDKSTKVSILSKSLKMASQVGYHKVNGASLLLWQITQTGWKQLLDGNWQLFPSDGSLLKNAIPDDPVNVAFRYQARTENKKLIPLIVDQPQQDSNL